MDENIFDWWLSSIPCGLKSIPFEEFGKTEIVGKGGFGSVFKATWKPKSIPFNFGEGGSGSVFIPEGGFGFVFKAAWISEVESKSYIKELIHELKMINRINEVNVSYYEFAKEGNLRDYLLKKNGHLQWKEKIRLATQIAEGVLYLHNELNIIHRDLHTKNILGYNGDIKILDFRLSKRFGSTSTISSELFDVISFIDPQKFIDIHYRLDKRSDIYSIGVVLWGISGLRNRTVRNRNGGKSNQIYFCSIRNSPMPKNILELNINYSIEFNQNVVRCHNLADGDLHIMENELHYIKLSKERVTDFINSVIGTKAIFPGSFQNSPLLERNNEMKVDTNEQNELLKCHFGLIANKQGLSKTNKEYINFYATPKIHLVNPNGIWEVSLITTNSKVHSYLLKNNVAISENRAHRFFESIRFIIPDFISTHLDLNDDVFQATHCDITAPLAEISFEDIKPSDELIQTLENALLNTNPYLTLCGVFEKFGHLIPRKITIGKKLTYNSQEFPPDQLMETTVSTMSKKFHGIEDKWGGIGFENEDYARIDHIEELISDDPLLEIIEYSNLIPTYEILDPSMRMKIEKCFKKKSQILMTGYIIIEDVHICDYFVEFDAPLQSDSYRIFGFVTDNNSKKLENSVAVFNSFTKYGFSVTLKRLYNEKVTVDHKISWMMVGFPSEVGFYSIYTRDLKIESDQEVDVVFSSEKKEYEIELSDLSDVSNCVLGSLIEFPQNANIPFMEIQYFGKNVIKVTSHDGFINNNRFDNHFDNFLFRYIFLIFPLNQKWIVPDIKMISNKKELAQRLSLWNIALQKSSRLYGNDFGYTLPGNA